MLTSLHPKPPFNFAQMLRRQNRTGKNAIARIDEENLTYRRAVRLRKRVTLLHVTFQGSVEEPELVLHHSGGLDGEDLQELIQLTRRMFSLDVDLQGFYRHFADDPHMGPVIRRFYGLRPVLEPDLFETMVKTIISQQLNLSFAASLIDRLVGLAGEQYEADGEIYAVFPTPEAVARLDPSQLRELSFSQRKAEYVIDFARAIVEGKVDLDQLWQMSDEEVMETLLQLRGIGRWSVECLMLFGMGRTDLLPAADIGLRNAVKKAWNLPGQPTEKEVREIGASWSPWSSYATYYLWESLSN